MNSITNIITIMADFFELLQYPFFTRAILVGALFSCICALLGIFIVLRKESLVGHTVANVSFLGIVLGIVLQGQPMLTAIGCSVVVALLLVVLQRVTPSSRDSLLALVDQGSIALAIVLITTLQGYRTDLLQYLFGDILAVAKSDVGMSIVLSLIVIFALVWLYKPLLRITFDRELALASGTHAFWYEVVYMVLLALVVSLGIKIIGVILLASFLVIPATIAMVIARSNRQVLFYSAGAGVVATICGLFLSYAFDSPSGATIILVLVGEYCLALLITSVTRKSK